MGRVRLVLEGHAAQDDFWSSAARQRLFVGGIGSGKTWAGCVEILRQPAGSAGVVLAPTYPMLRDATWRTFNDLARPAGLIAYHNDSRFETQLINGTRILWRSADKPDRLRGPNLGWAWVDEAAYCPDATFEVVLGRLRLPPARLWLTTSPTGKRGKVWELFGASAHPDRHLVRAKTSDNSFLPSDFASGLRDQYGDLFAAQELDGEFVDWSGGLFRAEWFPRLYLPASALPARLRWVRAWDVAFSAKSSADETAGVRAALDRTTNTLYLASPLAARLEAPDARELIIQTALADGREIPVHVEAVASQVATVQDLTRDPRLLAHRVHPIRPQGDKVASAVPFASRAAAGTVRLVGTPAEWAGWLEQWLAFPSGAHDDRVDAVSRAIEALAEDPTAWLAPLRR